MPAEGSTLELVAFVKGENIRDLTAGGRVYIAVKVLPLNDRESDRQESSAFAVFDFQGDVDWVLLKATLEDFPKHTGNSKCPTLT